MNDDTDFSLALGKVSQGGYQLAHRRGQSQRCGLLRLHPAAIGFVGDARCSRDLQQERSDFQPVVTETMMAFGGPDSKRTADLIVESSKAAQDGALKGVVVLFIGAQADSDRVKDALVKSAAEYRFVEMK